MSEILAQQRNIERKRSLDRNDSSTFDLRRENQGKLCHFSWFYRILEYKRIIQQIQQLLPAFDQVDKAKSRMSFRNNSLERYNQSCTMLDESINGSTRDLFFDCEEELYMSGEDSSDEEQTG